MSGRPKRAAAAIPSAGHAPKRRLTNQPELVQKHIEKLDKLRGNAALTREDRITILRVHFAVVREAHEKEAKSGRKVPVKAVERTARLLGRSKNTVGTVVKEWTDNHSGADETEAGAAEAVASNTGKKGNCKAKKARVPSSKNVYYKVRDYVREMRLERKRITATQVLEFLVEQGVISVPSEAPGIYEPKAHAATTRAVQRYLLRAGFERGRKTGDIRVDEERIAWRDRYVREVLANRALPDDRRLREVYLDESYVHQDHHRQEYSMHDPNDQLDEVLKTPKKGRRCYILAAIQGVGVKQSALGGLVCGSQKIFCPQYKGASTGDNHKKFNSENFTKWWVEQLLPNLHEPSLIIMDNAAYHKHFSPDTPKPTKMKKTEVLAALAERGIAVPDGISAVEAKVLLRKWIKDNVKPWVVELAEKEGHRVIFTPPNYSDLQPIERVWALIKGNIGRQYDRHTSLKDVKQRLDAEFDKLQTREGMEQVTRIIGSVDKLLERFRKEAEDNVDDIADLGDDDSDAGDEDLGADCGASSDSSSDGEDSPSFAC